MALPIWTMSTSKCDRKEEVNEEKCILKEGEEQETVNIAIHTTPFGAKNRTLCALHLATEQKCANWPVHNNHLPVLALPATNHYESTPSVVVAGCNTFHAIQW